MIRFYFIDIVINPTYHYRQIGATAYFGEVQISDGHTFAGKVPVYIKELKAPVMLEEDYAIQAVVCDDELCHKLARLLMVPFSGTNVTNLEGVGMPHDGLHAAGHMKGPTANGRPM
jgi:hypothetical protein